VTGTVMLTLLSPIEALSESWTDTEEHKNDTVQNDGCRNSRSVSGIRNLQRRINNLQLHLCP